MSNGTYNSKGKSTVSVSVLNLKNPNNTWDGHRAPNIN